MKTVSTKQPEAFIKALAEELKKIACIKPPEWLSSVKTSHGRERLPEQEDFWFHRCASLLRTLCIHGNRGVRRLKHKYGGKKKHVVHSPHHVTGSGKIIRVALQQLEKAGLVVKEKTGRIISSQGNALLDKIK